MGGDSITSQISSQLPPLEIAGADAARAIARLATEILPGAWSEPAFGEELARTDSRTWIAWDPEAARGRVAGFLILRLGPEVGEVLSVGVAIHWRSRGLGRFLVEAAVAVT
jgi:ribosomal protein S18 acetylase RimI-like enzyme